MSNNIEELKSNAIAQINSAESHEELEQLRVKYLGKKGELKAILDRLGSYPPEERPIIGKKANELKNELTALLNARKQELARRAAELSTLKEALDITIPGRKPRIGNLHPLTKTLYEIEDIFISMGFSIEIGPDIELEYYNFEALNFPAHHPARDAHDSFYISDGIILRTHTSPVQIRTMEKQQPPIRMIAPGRCYRRDAIDASHYTMFNQVEGLCVDEHITFADLKGTITLFLQQLFGKDTKVRFRPDFFPFTEPSVEVAMSCSICKGSGCRTCKQSGWLEIAGAGMVHPEVFRAVNYDSEKYTGFAFGFGIDRITMLKYGINDIRLLFGNDLRFLQQF
ncbi:MAG: phenylalanine--tRNA ligase subunit alpha [bacterium]|nr:phenylalanine--tRNA ligase subunit alpha [bacterium]